MSTERTAQWESYISGPPSADLENAIRRGVIDAGITLEYLNKTTSGRWLTKTETVYFKVSGPHSRVAALEQAVQAAVSEVNQS